MRYCIAIAVILSSACQACAQSVPWSFAEPRMKWEFKAAFPSYSEVSGKGGVLVSFVKCTPRQVQGCTACSLAGALHGITDGPAVVVSRDGYWLATLPCGATDKEIRIAAGLERPVSAIPFPSSRAVGLIASPDGKFRAELPPYFDKHYCPQCGTRQYAISGYNPDRTHNHTCPRCSMTWRH